MQSQLEKVQGCNVTLQLTGSYDERLDRFIENILFGLKVSKTMTHQVASVEDGKRIVELISQCILNLIR